MQEVINNKVCISLCMHELRLLIVMYKCTDEESSINV